MRWGGKGGDTASKGTEEENRGLLSDLSELDPLSRSSSHRGTGSGRSFVPAWASGGGAALTHGHSHGGVPCDGHGDAAHGGAEDARGNEARLLAVMLLNLGYTLCAPCPLLPPPPEVPRPPR